MELWIRSQSRHNLMKVNDIVAEDNQIVVYKESENSTIVGKYKTKERALEVLDEIQNILNLKDMYKNDKELVLKGWENVDAEQVKIVRQQISVYEMPKE